MNSGFDPMIVAPSLFKKQTASQQAPFFFGGSQVPIHLGIKGGGMTSSKVGIEVSIPKPKIEISEETRRLRDLIKKQNRHKADILREYLKEKSKKKVMEGGRAIQPPQTPPTPPIRAEPEPRIQRQTRRQIIEMLNETIELLDMEEQEFGDDPNIDEKVNNFEEIDRRIRIILNGNPTERLGRAIVDYLADYTQSPIEPFYPPPF